MGKRPVGSDFLEYNAVSGTFTKSADQVVRDDVEKHYWLSVLRTILRDWRLYLMLIPMILVFLFWRYFPMYELLDCFKDSGNELLSVAERPFIGFYNFKILLFGNKDISLDFWRAFRNTFLLSFYGLAFGFPMPIIIALFFNEIKSNVLRSFYQVLTYLPKFMSTVVITTLLVLLLNGSTAAGNNENYGIISKFLVGLGLDVEMAKTGLLQRPEYFRAIYEISGIWETAGYDSIVFFAAVIAVSPTNYEAAQIDGAGKLAQMRHVVLPSILSTVIIMLITKIGTLLTIGYEKVYLLTTYTSMSGNRETAEVISTFAIRYGMASDQGTFKSLAAAAEMMNNIIGMILVIGANTIARKASDVSLY